MNSFNSFISDSNTLKKKAHQSFLIVVQDECLSGGHGLMVQGYEPVIRTIAKDIDIRLNHR